MFRSFIIFILALVSTSTFAQLSQKDLRQLENTVKANYMRNNAEGSNLFKTKSGYRVLVTTVVASDNESNQSIRNKSARLATEFILGAENKSVSVTESEFSTTSSKESFSDKIVQTSLGHVKEMQSLATFEGNDGEKVHAYYLIMSKTNAKNGLAGVMSMVIPGTGQFYKGKTFKGAMFLGLTVAAGAGVLVCESTRSSYRNKAIEQPKYKKEYSTKADNWETYRNVCIGVAGAVYVWNVIDAFFTKSAQRAIVTSKNSSLTIAPHASFDNVGVGLAYNF